MRYKTGDLRTREIQELVSPSRVHRELAITEKAAKTVVDARLAIHGILHGADDRLVVIIGPCSIHDVNAAAEYAAKLLSVKKRLANELVVPMRVYFEKSKALDSAATICALARSTL